MFYTIVCAPVTKLGQSEENCCFAASRSGPRAEHSVERSLQSGFRRVLFRRETESGRCTLYHRVQINYTHVCSLPRSLPSVDIDHVSDMAGPSSYTMDDFLAPVIKSASAKRKTRGPRDANAGGRLSLSIFDIPPGLLTDADGVMPRDGAVSTSLDQVTGGPTIVHTETRTNSTRGLTCIRCGLHFAQDRPAQVLHFKSDLHLANLRRQLAGRPPISQQQLDVETTAEAAAVGGGDGTDAAGPAAEGDSSSDTDGDDAAGTTDRGLALDDVAEEGEDAHGDILATVDGGGGGGVESGSKRGRVRLDFSLQEGPRLTFVPRGSGWAFSLSSAALGMERGDDPWARLDGLLGDEGGGMNRLWAVVILRSGKFAAGVFEGQAVLCHKVFRRCVRVGSKHVACSAITAVTVSHHVWMARMRKQPPSLKRDHGIRRVRNN